MNGALTTGSAQLKAPVSPGDESCRSERALSSDQQGHRFLIAHSAVLEPSNTADSQVPFDSSKSFGLANDSKAAKPGSQTVLRVGLRE